MIKFFLKFFLIILVILISLVVYLSYFGVETDKFDYLIKKKTNEIKQNVKLEFNKTKIHLNPSELNLTVKLIDPKIIVRDSQINLSRLNLFISIKSISYKLFVSFKLSKSSFR